MQSLNAKKQHYWGATPAALFTNRGFRLNISYRTFKRRIVMKIDKKPVRKRGIPLLKTDFLPGEPIVCGKIPDLIKALIIDVDGTLFRRDDPFFRARRTAQYRWLCQRLDLPLPALKKAIVEEELRLSASANGNRVSFSQIVYGLDPTIECAEWQKVMTMSVPTNDYSARLRPNSDLEEAISDLTADRLEGVKIVFATNASAGTAEHVLKMLFGARLFNHGMFGVVGHDKKISKPDPAFFSELVGPALLQKGIRLAHAVSIGDRLGDDGYAAVKAGVSGAIIVDGPKELAGVLRAVHKLRKKT